ncbi:alpha/beta fold hydrolase [Lentzea albida]|uniref:Pimeloyl-ACP methyl ester carboxylesterase n=1 Tax=Lentzea albida TaxID=65499 RepID=A0A1H9QEU7_9PSEU|nr:alpha/beta hydrolase [Lentzea albida]SER58994.1 Pimeloyl-ACP methyl ester carboxylesterase [Lentzea albida]
MLLHHFTAALDDWDPAVVDGLAERHRVVLVDLRGVGGSGGTTPGTVEVMAEDLAAFVRALGFDEVDLLGVSMGGMIAQVLAQREPALVRRMILAGTSPAGDEGPANALALLQNALQRSAAEGKHPKHVLFFSPTATSQHADDAFLARLSERTQDRDVEVSDETVGAQATALANWEPRSSPEGLASVRQPVLVVNGDNDVMTPTISSFNLVRYLPNAQLSIYPDAGHGALFQHHELFVEQALEFLNA